MGLADTEEGEELYYAIRVSVGFCTRRKSTS
jgi:hypothetical protein